MPLPRPGSLRLPLLLGGTVVVLAVIGVVFTLGKRPAGDSTTTTNTAVSGSVEAVNVPVRQDADADGLTDAEEAILGTDPAKPDTDSDGLSDREEAKVYGTDPLKADTDGDAHPDGEEVASGFNPTGAGELLPTEGALRNLNAGSTTAP